MYTIMNNNDNTDHIRQAMSVPPGPTYSSHVQSSASTAVASHSIGVT